MTIIVGLGNPGLKYRDTRHNVGFMVLDRLAERLEAGFTREQYGGLVAVAYCAGERILLVKPLTYMNNSGDCVARAVRKNGLTDLTRLLIVLDDVHLPLGRIRVRPCGSAGGHNGLQSIIDRLGTPEFPRLRLGIDDAGAVDGLTGHVLGKFRREERPEVAEMVPRAVDATVCYLTEGLERTMNDFNQSAGPAGTDD